MGNSDEKITVESVNVPGYTSRVNKAKYEAMKQALWQALPASPPGLTQKEIGQAILPYLSQELFPGGAKSGWWFKTVQLDQEAKGNIIRHPGKPLRWYLAPKSD